MNGKRFVQKSKFWLWMLLFVAYAAFAAGIVVDTLKPEYRGLTQVSVVSVESPREARIKGASQVAAIYRATSGAPFTSLPPGTTFKIVWPDGSSETVVVGDPRSSTGAKLLPGTQQPSAE
jgi:P pilus assembly chaperone PapD